MRYNFFYTILLPLLVLFSLLVEIRAQSVDSLPEQLVTNQIWIDFYPNFFINEKLQYYGDAGFRTIADEQSWNRFYVRPSIRYHMNQTISFQGGLGFFYIYNKYNINRFEITPWQGVQIKWPNLSIFDVKHLGKIEERYSVQTANSSSSFNLRLRYKMSGNFDVWDIQVFKSLYVPFYIELFYPLNDNIEEFYRNKTRFGAGLGYKISRAWDVAFIFNMQSSRAGPNDELNVSDYAYQLKIKRRWEKK